MQNGLVFAYNFPLLVVCDENSPVTRCYNTEISCRESKIKMEYENAGHDEVILTCVPLTHPSGFLVILFFLVDELEYVALDKNDEKTTPSLHSSNL